MKHRRDALNEKIRLARKIRRAARKDPSLLAEMPVFPPHPRRKLKAYGVHWADQGCCPGHDKYPADRYRITKAAARRRAQQPRKTSARQAARRMIAQELRDSEA